MLRLQPISGFGLVETINQSSIIIPLLSASSTSPKQMSESRLFSISNETGSKIRSFRLARPTPGASVLIFSIDKTSHEVGPSEKLTFPPGRLEELQDELPDNAPRFVLLSYELEHRDGRKSNPLVMINYIPPTANTTLQTLYASAKVWFQEKADVGKVLDLTDIEELNDEWVKSYLLR